MDNLSVVYYSSNVMPEKSAQVFRNELLQVVGGLCPLISVTQLYFVEDVSWPNHLRKNLAQWKPELLSEGKNDRLVMIRK